MIYLTVWYGDEINWITVTPQHPYDEDSSYFDEGVCTGFKVAVDKTDSFVADYCKLMRK